jgi:uncharacterized protein
MAGVLLALGVYILARFTLGRTPRPRGRPYVRFRYLVPLGLGAGFVDATGGGGWGPVSTPTLIATGKLEPRKVVGSVDTSETLVALSASIGFLLALGSQAVKPAIVIALLAGGVVAAPLAAWLVQKVTARLLGAAVGGFIIITNLRTMFSVNGADLGTRAAVYAAIGAVWAIAIALVIRHDRRHRLPLLNPRPGAEAA